MISPKQKRISIAILVISIAGLVYYALRNWIDFQRLSLVNPAYFIPLLVLLILDYFVIGLITRGLAKPLGLSLGISEAFLISLMTGFYNMVLPFRGGMATRAVYLKTRHNYSYTNFLASLSAGYVLMYLIASFLGLGALSYTYASKGIASGVLFLVFSGVFVSLLFIVLFSPEVQEARLEWLNKIIRVINSWDRVKNDRGLVLAIAVLSSFQMLLETSSVFLQFKVFGIEVPFIKCIFLAAVGSLGQVIQITPAGLGVSEALILFSAQAIGVTPAETLAATLLGRAIAFVVLSILGPVSSYLLAKGALQERTSR